MPHVDDTIGTFLLTVEVYKGAHDSPKERRRCLSVSLASRVCPKLAKRGESARDSISVLKVPLGMEG